MNQYVICKMHGAIFSFLLENGRAVEIHCDSEGSESILGNIYTGRIRDISGTIGAAFIEIAPKKICYIPINELDQAIYTKKGASSKPQQGDELLVQVSREAIKTKYPSVTTNLTLHGKYILLTIGKKQVSASAKLNREEKQRLIGLIKEIEAENKWQTPGARAFGWLIRTNADGAARDTLLKDMNRLYTLYCSLVTDGKHRVCCSCLFSGPHTWISRLSDLYEQAADQFITDDKNIWEDAREYLSLYQPEDLSKLMLLHDDMQPLYKRYSLEKQLEDAINDRVWLKSGGYLVIQYTEALTVIDVNTGKFEGSVKNRQKAFFKINKEAALEAARQIRLRNMSGIILIDFINMESKEDEEELLQNLDEELRRDPIRTTLVDMTKLSLVEITRMKKERPLKEQISLLTEDHKAGS
ncbi:MAG: ribonuclease E/G [Lachnospiraceae bacterium]|nr:ribonuclease E/G [Lachnospiraceae bacterium]